MGIHCLCRSRHVAALVLVASALPSIARAQVVVRGVLYDDATGSAVTGAVMLIDPHSDAAVVHAATDSAGAFSLQTRDGVYQIAAVRPGYVSVLSAPVPLQNGERLTIRVPIAQTGDPQHKIGVVEHIRPGQSNAVRGQEALNGTGFEGRRSVGMGLHYTRQQLENTGRETLGDFLQTVPGISMRDPNSTSSLQMTRTGGIPPMTFTGSTMSSCHVGWFIDGQRVDLPGRSDPLTDGLGSMRLESIEAVEVFRGISEMPAQFAEPDLRCGVVALWLRRG
jgi:TonB-dependent Receptor Plug Domain